ncbi:MAG: hypothetical protein NT069_33480, partial [Planctomycetota bacterium]|nr:hypothetical protein [Planctomycetota bacterium]
MIHFQGAASEFTRLLVDSRRTILISADVTATVGNLDFTSFGAFAGVNPIQLEGARTLSAAGTLSLSSSIQKISASGNLNLKGG